MATGARGDMWVQLLLGSVVRPELAAEAAEACGTPVVLAERHLIGPG